MFYKRKIFIFVKNTGNEGEIATIDEKRRFNLQPDGRDPRNPALGNLPHSRRTEQTGIRFAAEDSPEVSARQSGLVAARLRTDVSNRQSEKFLFNERNRRWKWSD